MREASAEKTNQGWQQRQRGQARRGDPPNEPTPPERVWECFTQWEYPENSTTSRGAAPLTRSEAAGRRKDNNGETRTGSDRGGEGTHPMIQPQQRGYWSVSLSRSTPKTALHHAARPPCHPGRGAGARTRSPKTRTSSGSGGAGTHPMIQSHQMGYGSVSLCGSTAKTALHHAGRPPKRV